MDAFVIYTNNTRPSAVAYVTGFTPYWSDALMLVGKTGAPVFATALSKRVSEWIRTTDPLSEIVNTPKPGDADGRAAGEGRAAKRVGVLEYDTLPAGLGRRHGRGRADSRMDRRHGAVRRPAPRGRRRRTRDCWRAPMRWRVAALREAETGKAKDAGTLAGLVEQNARLAGAEETYIAVAPDLAADRRLNRTSQPTAAGGSLRGARLDRLQGLLGSPHAHVCQGRGEGRRVVRRRRALDRRPGSRSPRSSTAKVKELPGATLTSWMAESCTGSYPLSAIASSRMSGKGRAGERPVSGADRRADARRRAMDRRRAADCRENSRVLSSSSRRTCISTLSQSPSAG